MRSPIRLPVAVVALVCLVIGAVGFLSSCTPRVVASKSSVDVPRSFTTAGQEKLPVRWWRALGDPELNRLVKLALAGNLDLRAAWARLDQALAAARKAGAGLYPQINAEAGAAGAHANTGNSASFTLGVAATYEVDLWGRVRSTRNAARLDVLASRDSLRAAAISISAEVATAWYQLVERQGQVALLTQQIELNDKVLALVTFRFGQGLSRAADLLQQKQLIESLRGELSLVNSQAQVLRHQLALLTGQPPGKVVLSARRVLPTLPPLPRTGVPAKLLERRPDVRAAHHKVRAADQRVASAIADRFPRLSISAGASVTGGFNPASFHSWLANLAANLLAPIFDGGTRKAEVARTRAVAAEALAAYGKVVLVALREVEDALVRERLQRRYIVSLDKQLKLSTAVIAQVQLQYGNGEQEYLRVLDALIKHQTITRAGLTSRRDLVLHRVALCRALAGSWKLKRPKAKTKTKTQTTSKKPAPRTGR